MDRPPFDPVRAAFLLVAGCRRRAGLRDLGLCRSLRLAQREIITGTDINCDPNSRLMGLMAAALAAALAFAGVRK